MSKIYDFLFELTEDSDNEGEQFLVECGSLNEAYKILVEDNGFDYKELRFIERMSVAEGEWLGLDTY